MSDRDAEMDEEMREHVRLLTEQNVTGGMSPAEARRAALLRFGSRDSAREACRDQRRFARLENLVQDVRYGARLLRKAPGFTAVALLTLALGIGACTAIFSVVDGVLLRPLPYPEPDQLVALREVALPRFPGDFVRPDSYLEWRKQATTFDNLAAVRSRSYNLTGAGTPVLVSAARMTANTLSALRLRPAMGRDFLAEEDVPGKGNVAILSHAFWLRHFGGRPDVLHEVIQLDGQPFAIVGVMPRGFQLDAPLDLFTPAAYTTNDPQNRRSLGARSINVFGRLKPGVTVEQARNEMTLIARRLAEQRPENEGWSVQVTPMLEDRVGNVGSVLLALVGAVSLLLLIACANVANLLLARATVRSREIAVRTALGASPSRIRCQLLTESLLLALAGGVLGAVFAQGGVTALVAVAPGSLPRAAEIVVDGHALGLACALAVLTGIAFGLAPTWLATRIHLRDRLSEGGRGGIEGGGRQRLRGAFVVAELATALVLLAGAGLLMRSFVDMQNVDRGFAPEGAVTFELSLPQETYRTDQQIVDFAQRAADRLSSVPGVQSVGASQALPFSVDMNIGAFEIAGRLAVRVPPTMHVFEVTPGYFRAMGIRLLRGRLFDAHDVANRPRVGIINEALAKTYFGTEDPIGKRIHPPGRPDRGGEIVGVVADVRDGRVAKLDGNVGNQVYVSLAQNPYDVLTFVVRTAEFGPDLPTALRDAIRDIDKNQSISSIRPLGELVSDSIARQRFATLLFAVFSAVALLLAAIGLYGVLSYAVLERTQEIGVRMALGAQARDVLRLVFAHGGRIIAVGVLAGLLGALLLTRFLESMLFGLGTRDPLTLAGTAVLLILVAIVACLVPALRATRVDPMTALRAE